MNELPKIVFSRTLEKVEWKNSRLAKGDVAEEVARLRRQPGKDIALFGSAELASTFMPLGLIDEYRILVNPIVLGDGRPDVQEHQGQNCFETLEHTDVAFRSRHPQLPASLIAEGCLNDSVEVS